MLMSRFEEITPVSSAKVARVVSSEWGISTVKIIYSVGTSMLHWGTRTPVLMDELKIVRHRSEP